MAHLEGAFLQVDRRLESLDLRMESRFTQVESRFNQLELRLDARFSIIDQRFNWLIGIVVVSWISTVMTVLFHH